MGGVWILVTESLTRPGNYTRLSGWWVKVPLTFGLFVVEHNVILSYYGSPSKRRKRPARQNVPINTTIMELHTAISSVYVSHYTYCVCMYL